MPSPARKQPRLWLASTYLPQDIFNHIPRTPRLSASGNREDSVCRKVDGCTERDDHDLRQFVLCLPSTVAENHWSFARIG